MEVDGRLFQVGMAQQHLNGAQVGAGFEQVSCEAVAKSVGVKLFPDSRAFGGFAAGVPDDFGADWILGGGMPSAAREQPLGRFPAQPAKMLPEFFEQMRAEHCRPEREPPSAGCRYR